MPPVPPPLLLGALVLLLADPTAVAFAARPAVASSQGCVSLRACSSAPSRVAE